MKLHELREARAPRRVPLSQRDQRPVAYADDDGPRMDPDMLRNREFFAPAAAGTDRPLAQRQQAQSRAMSAASRTDMSSMPSINTAGLPAWAMNDDDDEDETSGYDEPETKPPGTDLANIEKGVAAQSWQNPEWLNISDLPGYMQQGIRAVGKTVFHTLTSTPLKDISILANLQGGGPSEERELNAVAHHAHATATEPRDLSMQFGEVIPGYAPDAKLYAGEDDTYLIVQDEMGKYIYHWPSSETKSMGGQPRAGRGQVGGRQQRRIR